MGLIAPWVGNGLAAVGIVLNLKQADSRLQRIVTEHIERLTPFGTEVRDLTRLDDDDIIERLAAIPALVDLLVCIYEELRRSSVEEKRGAFARLMASALDDDGATIDNKRLLERALEELEVAHMRALRAIASGPPGRYIDDKGNRMTGGTSLELLRKQLPDVGGANIAIAATLTSLGLVEDVSIGAYGGGPSRWSVTEFGEELMPYLVVT